MGLVAFVCSGIFHQQQVYDIITRRFIAAFYEECEVGNTAVIGKADDVNFKTTGKVIVKKGWREVFEWGVLKEKKEEFLFLQKI